MPEWDGCRWDRKSGHYESWFQRANHPTRPLALWVRHTIFCPAGNPAAAEGEIWAIWFDGEKNQTVTGKTELPSGSCSFSRTGLDVNLVHAQLKPGSLAGGSGKLSWKLEWAAKSPPSLLYIPAFYSGPFPKAKALCNAPNAIFTGSFDVEGQVHSIDGWLGSHNHNWGSRHTDVYAWTQVCGFDGAPDVFLECGTGRVMIGPVMSPRLGVAVLNLEGRRIALNSVPRMLLSTGRANDFRMRLQISGDGVDLDVATEAPRERFVALRYRNPPGGVKACLNSKLAGCTLHVTEKGKRRTFTAAHRAAFEILCDENDPRVQQVGGFSA